MSQARKPDPDDARPGGGPTPVPPRAGKGRGGGARGRGPANRPAAGRPQANRGSRQARQAAQRRNRILAAVAVVVVVAVVAVVVAIGVSSGGGGAPRQPAPAAAVSQMENVSMTSLVQAAGLDKQLNFAQKAAGGPLTQGGKPVVLFIGAEFCPICAAQRWPMTIALMKFGTFTNLKQTHSAKSDGNAGTWSYYGATYTSPYLVFRPYEIYTNQPSGNYYKTLDKLPADAQANWSANEGTNESFPFINFGGKAVLETAQYDPSTIYYRSFDSILGYVGVNDNTIGASINASAAVFTKYLCGLTNNQPGNVCSAVAHVSAPIGSSNTGSSTPSGG